MRGTYPFIFFATLATTAFFLWARGQTRRRHAGYRHNDVKKAIEQVLAPISVSLDDWELFLKWPIDDPYLEKIRQHCRQIVADWPRTKVTEYMGKEGLAELEVVYREFCRMPNQLPDPTSPSVTPPADAGGAPSVAADH
jgi:hypothetical protein